MRTRAAIALAFCLATSACSGPPAPPATTPATDRLTLAVYAPPELEGELLPLIEAYEAETGVRARGYFPAVEPEHDALAQLEPPADVLLLATAAQAVRAADAGALRPVTGALAPSLVSAGLRDPDGAWIGVAWQPAALVYDVRAARAEDLTGYTALAGPAFAGRLCLSSSAGTANSAVLAALIDQLGVRPAERIVRGWVSNLARPVFASDAELREALANGDCAVGILPALAGGGAGGVTTTLRYITPPEPAGRLVAGGVGRHSAQPDAALALLGWLVTQSPLAGAARAVDDAALPATPAAVTGWLDEDARKLAERAGYR